MTDNDKALVERLRDESIVEKHWMMDSDAIEEQRKEAAALIEAQAAEIEALKRDHTSLVAELNKTRALLKGYRRGFKKARLGETE